MDPLDQVFHQLDRWRHLPNYQLERRADIFFSVYLKGLVEERTGIILEDEIIPELPIKRDLIWPDHPTEKSVKVDYVLFAKDRSRVFFVELKTDAGSRRDAQDHYLDRAREVGFRRVVEGIRSIMLATNAHQKYHHLACMLARLGYLELPADLETFVHPAARLGLTERLKAIKVSQHEPALSIIYVQPNATPGDDCIDFAAFAAYVERFADPLSKHFSKHLRAWTSPAGACLPTS
jgi:hypothetical protein